MKKLVALLLVGTFAFTLAACNGDDDVEEVNLDYVNWAEGIAMNYLAEVLIEDEMGYDVNSTEGEPGVVFTSVAEGDADFFVDAWLPLTHESYWDQYGDDILDLGYNFEEAPIGLVVPDYVDIDSIDELNDYEDEFGGEIVGIEPGAGIMEATDNAIEEYDLNFTLEDTSDPVMVAELGDAIENDEWIVVTGWEPHYKFADYDLKFLDDPEDVYGEPDNIHTVARPGADEDLPEVTEFFENFYFTSEELGDLMGDFQEYGDDMDDAEIARQWAEENEDIWSDWIPE